MAHSNNNPNITLYVLTINMLLKDLRKLRRVEDRFDSSGIDGNNGDYDTSQEKGGKFVDIFDPHKDDHSHKAQTYCAVYPHVIQHRTTPCMNICGMEYGSLRNQVFL